MRDTIITILCLSLGVATFEIINLIGIKQTGTVPGLARYALLTGVFQILGYFIFVYGLNLGFKTFAKDIWLLMFSQIAISYFIKIALRYQLFHQPLVKGNLAALCLAVLAAIISKVWK